MSAPTQLRGILREHRADASIVAIITILVALVATGVLPVAAVWLAAVVGLTRPTLEGLALLRRERRVGTELFITVATLAALAGGEAVAGGIMLTVIRVAELIEEVNASRARAQIRATVDQLPRRALRRGPKGDESIPVEDLEPGTTVLVRAGEVLPVDGRVSGGSGAVNEAPITGEATPVEKAAGDPVFAGSVLVSGALDVEVERVGEETLAARIISLVEGVEENRAPVQRLADRIANVLLPVAFVFIAAVYLVTRDVRTVVGLLIFASPAELVLATPMAMIAAAARLARHGVLVKGGAALEALASADTVVFDKTGTLTQGVARVAHVQADGQLNEDDLLRLAASAEQRSAHPIAQAVVAHAAAQGLDLLGAERFTAQEGRGVDALLDGRSVRVGSRRFVMEMGLPEARSDCADPTHTPVHVAVDGAWAGSICVEDTPRAGSEEVLRALAREGFRTVMLSGDRQEAAEQVGAALGVAEVHGGLLPHEKLEAIRSLQRQGHRVVMVGDGINDAPALAQADVGIAMGVIGTRAALEAADMGLMTDDLRGVLLARQVARRAMRTVKENVVLGVGLVHTAGMALVITGLLGPVGAAVGHAIPDLLVFLNSVRLLRDQAGPGASWSSFKA